MTSISYPISAAITAKEKRLQPIKHYVFIVVVTWSDGSKIPIYRHYSDFAQLHTDLKEVASSLNVTSQQLPVFPEKKVFQRAEVRKTAAAFKHSFDDYCQAVLKLPPAISQHKTIVSFFKARPDDISPPLDTTDESSKKNSSWLTTITGKLRPKDDKNATNLKEDEIAEDDPIYISSPIVCETYLAIADYTPEEKSEIKLKENMSVEVVEKYDSGWWFVQTEYGFGWAPATYLEPIGSKDEAEDPEPIYAGNKYLTTQQYSSEQEDEISFPEGVLVKVLHKLLDGWWVIEYQNKIGYAPAAFLVSFKNPHYRDSVQERKHSTKPTKRRTIIKNSKGQNLSTRKKRDLSIYKKMSEINSGAASTSDQAMVKPKISPNTPNKSGIFNGAKSPKKHDYDYIDEDEMDHIDDWLGTAPPLPRRSSEGNVNASSDMIDSLPDRSTSLAPGLVQVKPPVTLKPDAGGMVFVNSPRLSRAAGNEMNCACQEKRSKTSSPPSASSGNERSPSPIGENIYDTAAPGMVYARAPTYKAVPNLPCTFVDSLEEEDSGESGSGGSFKQLTSQPDKAANHPSRTQQTDNTPPIYAVPTGKKSTSLFDNSKSNTSENTTDEGAKKETGSSNKPETTASQVVMEALIQSLKNRSISSVRTNEYGELVIKFND